MFYRSLVASAVLSPCMLVLSGCSGETLDYETALNLLKDRRTEPVTMSFSASPGPAQADPKVKEAYDKLVEGHVLVCDSQAVIGTLCQPGPAADGLTTAGSTDLTLVVGRWIPSVISRITRSARGTAVGEARLLFEPSPLYNEYRESFDVMQTSAEGRLKLTELKEGKTVQFTCARAEDGWHLDSVQ